MSEMSIRERYYNALYNKTEEADRLATSKELDDYFKKQEATKKAIDALQRGVEVPADVAEIVDVDALKASMETNEGEDATNALTKQIGGSSNSGLDEFVPQGPSEALDSDLYKECCQSMLQALKLNEIASDKMTPTDRMNAQIEKMLGTTLIDSTQNDFDVSGDYFNPLVQNAMESANSLLSLFDDFSEMNVSIQISVEVQAKLEANFGDLESSAEYVKGWYYDAAYRVGYLGADANQDGNIGFEEAKDLKALIGITPDGTTDYLSINDAISDKSKRDDFLNAFGFIDNITDFINNSIMQDLDMDGGLKLNELVGDDKVIDVAAAIVSDEPMGIFEFNSIAYGFQYEQFSFVSRLGGIMEDVDTQLAQESETSEEQDETTEDTIEV